MEALHSDPLPQVLFLLVAILVTAKIGGYVATRLRIPAVLGELGAGIVMGNAGLFMFGSTLLPEIRDNQYLALMAELGVILLMFEVGVEGTVKQIASVGSSAALSAVLGVAAPFLLGWGVGALLLPESGGMVHVFIGATLCATSVGISARVLQESGATQTPSGRTILGAAVIDDTLGLIILAIVVGLITSETANVWVEAGRVTFQAAAFLGGGLALGLLFSKPLYRLTSKIQVSGMLLTVSLVLCFAFAYGAHLAGLAPIVGAFAAGLILEPEHQTFYAASEGEHHRSLEDLLHPLSALFVPLFFVQTGAKVDLRALLSPEAMMLGLVLTVAAVFGKLACAAGVVDRTIDRWTVALGMIPRGEVGLIFAGIGATLTVGGEPVITPTLYSAIIVMVILTTLIPPLLLPARLRRLKLDTEPPPESGAAPGH
ncbi:MAG: cation:proton antiporter [Deltaproteobacteria bacterium]|nr:cation:proton antiporter [Deltaproteobacteria bacterium]